MKKITIAGIAAVALLTVAPAVTTTTAQAGILGNIFSSTTTNNGEQITDLENVINNMPDQTYDESNPMPITTLFNSMVGLAENGNGVMPVQFSAEFVSINSGMDKTATSAFAKANIQNLKMYVTAPTSASALKKAITKAYTKGNGNSFAFTIVLKNGENTLASKKITYTNNTKMAVDDDDTDGTATTPTTPTTPTNGLSNVTELTGNHTVTLAGPSGFVYSLYSQAGKKSNRGLAGETGWYTDKTATDANGTTYYRVSTDEWIAASTGVTFN